MRVFPPIRHAFSPARMGDLPASRTGGMPRRMARASVRAEQNPSGGEAWGRHGAARRYGFGTSGFTPNALAAQIGHAGSASNARASSTTSARPFATISAAWVGSVIIAPVAMPAWLRIASANGT
jgi:hypothetical protein